MSENAPVPQPQKSIALPARTGAQKAAAVLALLDKETLQVLAGRLPERHRDRLMNTISGLKSVPLDEQRRIVREFAERLGRERNAVRGNERIAHRLVGALFEDNDDDMPVMETAEEHEFNPVAMSVWDRAANLPLEKLTGFFAEKPVSVVSIALRELPEDKASELAGALPEDLTRDSILQIATQSHVNPVAVDAIEALIETQLLAVAEAETDDEEESNSAKVAALLNRMTTSRREMVLEALGSKLDDDELGEIAALVLSFESLDDRVPRNAIPLLFREMEEKTILTALKYTMGMRQPVAEYLLGNISQRIAGTLREQLDAMGDVTADDGEKAQTLVVCKILEMVDEGRVKLLDPTD